MPVALARLTRKSKPDRDGPKGIVRTAIFAFVVAAAMHLDCAMATQIASARVWPAPEYTRLTLESQTPIAYNVFTVGTPARLVLDLEDVEFNSVLEFLPGKISPGDPYVNGVRIGRFKPGVVRLVLDLKTQVKPQVFTLKPVGEYGHRLVLDVYPLTEPDPVMALLEKKDPAPATAAPANPPAAAPPGAAERMPANPAASPAPSAKKPAAPANVARLITIAIDAGHGGEDPGARGRSGTHEKDVTLAIARKLKELVDDETNMRGVLIRDGDYFIPLANRVIKARKIEADLFVSIHADAYVKPHARGSSVFALSERGATSAAAGWLARKENEADLIGGVNIDVADPTLKQVLFDLSQTATINDSLKLAKAVLGSIGGVNDLHKSHVEQAGFAVLKAPDIPSILVETAFLTNPDEERKLKDDRYQDKLAQAILVGIRKYFSANPPLARSKLAQNESARIR
ncbi:MAG TPA: N-acetylmuramoyl-L-alanine amidase [Burkholderiales bacterium]|nr:N-acetylmuramoyl-L-alanine amidase [Burkholderiales bacterium]